MNRSHIGPLIGSLTLTLLAGVAPADPVTQDSSTEKSSVEWRIRPQSGLWFASAGYPSAALRLGGTALAPASVAVPAAGAVPPAAAASGERSTGGAPRRLRNWSASWQSGITQGMQLSLGGLFNRGPAQQNRLTVTKAHWLRTGDSVQFYGWGTTDLRKAYTDFDTGFRYRTPLRRVAYGKLIGGGGLEHWNFPSVLGGTKDLVLDSYLGWSGGEKIPITISGNGKTLLRSDLTRGTFAIFTALHTQRLGKLGESSFSVQHGPAYVYNWNLYGKNGHRVLRYTGTLNINRGRWGAELMLRPQAGLQPRIPDNKYWSVSLIRRFGP